MNKTSILIALTCCSLALAGCTFERENTTINTPAVYAVSGDVATGLKTNLVSAAAVQTTVKKERMLLPEGYALLEENDIFGLDVSMTSASSTLPNIRLGQAHQALRWLPTSTNNINIPSLSSSGSYDSKGVPFWNSMHGQFTAGPAHVASLTDTNGTTTDAGAIVPGTPTSQQK